MTDWLSLGISYATTAYGGGGQDTFTVYSNKATLKLFGIAGDNTFIIRAFLLDQDTSETGTDQTYVNGGSGNNLIEYNINAPVTVDGGHGGFNTLVVVGTGAGDNFVITATAIIGAGLYVTYSDIQEIEVDGVGGDNNFYVLSTAPGVVTVLDGGSGSNTFNVGGDVTGRVVALNPNGTSAAINHSVASTDQAYNDVYAAGIEATVANSAIGQVVISQPAGGLNLVSSANPPAGSSEASYTVSLGESASDVAAGTLWFMSVAAAPTAADEGGSGIQVSTDGIHWSSSLVLEFDSSATSGATQWTRVQTIYVRAVDGSVLTDSTIEVMHSICASAGPGQTCNPIPVSDIGGFSDVPITDVDVHVLDGDLPGLVTTTPASGLDVIEGPLGNANSISLTQYTVSLTTAPAPGEIITVTPSSTDPRLSFTGPGGGASLTFNSTDWDVAQTVTIHAADDGVAEDPEYDTITDTVTTSMTTGGVYSNGVIDDAPVHATILDTDSAGVLVVQPTGQTIVSPSQPSSYTLQLTSAPTAPVIISLLDDGQTCLTSGDARFTAAASCNSGTPTVTFDSSNWNQPVTITVSVNPNPPTIPSNSNGQPVQVFTAQPHLTSALAGPLFIEGYDTAPRPLVPAVMLPSEISQDLNLYNQPPPAQYKINTLNVFDDGSIAGQTGTLGPISSTEFTCSARSTRRRSTPISTSRSSARSRGSG